MNSTWWAVARSEEVTGNKPLSVDLGDRPVVLWRDLQGCARALEDRCPHRRAPLSLGCIRKEGWIQCGYHGWSYDGETGRVKEIPNLKGEQRFPPLYRAERFAVHEASGFVRIASDVNATPPVTAPQNTVSSTAATPGARAALSDQAAPAAPMPLSGTSHVALDHERYLAVLFDDPGLVLTFFGVHFTTYLMSELHEQDGRLVLERNCQWKGLHWPAAFSSDYPLVLVSSTEPATGETALTLRDRDFKSLLVMTLAPVPAARGVTSVRWRGMLGDGLSNLSSSVLRKLTPIKVHGAVDGTALRKLKPSVSVMFEDLRRQLAPAPTQDPPIAQVSGDRQYA